MIEVFEKYREIFVDKQGNVKGFWGHMEVKSEVPIVQKFYPVCLVQGKI